LPKDLLMLQPTWALPAFVVGTVAIGQLLVIIPSMQPLGEFDNWRQATLIAQASWLTAIAHRSAHCQFGKKSKLMVHWAWFAVLLVLAIILSRLLNNYWPRASEFMLLLVISLSLTMAALIANTFTSKIKDRLVWWFALVFWPIFLFAISSKLKVRFEAMSAGTFKR
jgi:hypothetical protein